MPWKDCNIMSIRKEFITLATQEDANISCICHRFGISRKTGYKWIHRFKISGDNGLYNLISKPHHSPNKYGMAVEKVVLSVRGKHRAWGGRKIRSYLIRKDHRRVSELMSAFNLN